MNDDIDAAAQDDPEWVVWSSPERIQRAVDTLFVETLPTVPADWKTQTGSAYRIGPMPQGLDRYSNELTLHWLDDAFDYFFPDEDALFEPRNAELVNAFVAYIGEFFVRKCDGRWINNPDMGGVLSSGDGRLYGFGPTIRYDWIDETDYPVVMLFDAPGTDFRQAVSSAWYSREVDYAAAHGLDHEHLELRREHGLA
ncbi:hypothetical protein HGA13_31810 [Nocardia speluncae]|uniref:Uncharacterized protein n=1 Tax=Nocardia speluncae TaxID=419477 RepID=A0A846XMR1_9NOCA|nr:hypothetical protein [Nocardia speluncae]NKY37618.1 hypothetical protein [Nocardia speluncae]